MVLASLLCGQNRRAGSGALSVDRDRFSELVTKAITEHPNIEVMHGEVTEIPAEGVTVIASGPLTSDTLARTDHEFMRRCAQLFRCRRTDRHA